MPRIRILAVTLLLAGVVAIPAPAAATPANRLMVQKINAVRASHGLSRVRLSRSLTRSAFAYSRLMIAHDFFGHQSRIRASSRFNMLGEVIELHRGRRARVSRTLRSWLSSPAHRPILLHPSFRYVGAGKASGRFGGRRVTVWAVHLGRR